MPTAADFSKVSEDHRNSVVAQEEAKKLPRRPVGTVVTEESSTTTVVDSFFEALDKEVVLPVVWVNEVPEGHPLRDQSICVRLWDGPEWKEFNSLLAADISVATSAGFATNGDMLNWWALSKSVCDKAGKKLFNLPIVELRDKYCGPKHESVMESMLETALEYNGLKREVANRDAKKLVTTEASTSSGESVESKDAPSATPASHPPENSESLPS